MKMNLSFVEKKRKEKGLTMQNMAELLGFQSAPAYCNYEKGKREFRAGMLPILAHAFNCEIKDLYC